MLNTFIYLQYTVCVYLVVFSVGDKGPVIFISIHNIFIVSALLLKDVQTASSPIDVSASLVLICEVSSDSVSLYSGPVIGLLQPRR